MREYFFIGSGPGEGKSLDYLVQTTALILFVNF